MPRHNLLVISFRFATVRIVYHADGTIKVARLNPFQPFLSAKFPARTW
jgi:hypothetical protein